MGTAQSYQRGCNPMSDDFWCCETIAGCEGCYDNDSYGFMYVIGRWPTKCYDPGPSDLDHSDSDSDTGPVDYDDEDDCVDECPEEYDNDNPTASCEACQSGQSVEEYCSGDVSDDVSGCDKTICCNGLTASCQACKSGQTIEAYCRGDVPDYVTGCEP